MKKPTVADCKRLAAHYGVTSVMIVVADTRTENVAGASYGIDRAHCQAMGKHLDAAIDRLQEEGL